MRDDAIGSSLDKRRCRLRPRQLAGAYQPVLEFAEGLGRRGCRWPGPPPARRCQRPWRTARGLTVLDPDIGMITKGGGGGVHCMCQPLKRRPR